MTSWEDLEWGERSIWFNMDFRITKNPNETKNFTRPAITP